MKIGYLFGRFYSKEKAGTKKLMKPSSLTTHQLKQEFTFVSVYKIKTKNSLATSYNYKSNRKVLY